MIRSPSTTSCAVFRKPEPSYGRRTPCSRSVGGPATSDTVLWDDGQPQRLRWIVLKHHLEFSVGEAVRAHHLRKGAYARRGRVLPGTLDLGPEFRKKAEFRSHLTDRVHASAFKGIPEIELDPCPKLGGFLHLLHGHFADEIEGVGGDHVLHALAFRFEEHHQGIFGEDVA